MSFHKRAGAAALKRTLVCRAALALSAAAPLSAFAAEDAASVPAPVTQELAPTVVRANANPAPFARNTPAVVQSVTADQLADRNVVTAEDAVKYQPNVMVPPLHWRPQLHLRRPRLQRDPKRTRSAVCRRHPALEPAWLQLQLPAALVHGRAG
jgi:hypothetical protein